MHENQLNIDEIEDEYIDTMIRLAFKQEEALETQEMIAASKRPFTLEEQAAVENVRRRFIEVLSAKERAQKRENRFLRFQKYAPRILQAAAAVILILAIATPIAIANVASFRSAVMQLLLSFDESKQELHVDFSEDESAAFDVPAEWPGKYYISYIPDGYKISWQSAYKQATIEYTNAEGNTIYFVEGTSGTSLVSGTEGGQLTYFDIHGRPALVICAEENDNPYFNFTWAVDDRWFNLQTEGIEQDVAIHIAESVKKIIEN